MPYASKDTKIFFCGKEITGKLAIKAIEINERIEVGKAVMVEVKLEIFKEKEGTIFIDNKDDTVCYHIGQPDGGFDKEEMENFLVDMQSARSLVF